MLRFDQFAIATRNRQLRLTLNSCHVGILSLNYVRLIKKEGQTLFLHSKQDALRRDIYVIIAFRYCVSVKQETLKGRSFFVIAPTIPEERFKGERTTCIMYSRFDPVPESTCNSREKKGLVDTSHRVLLINWIPWQFRHINTENPVQNPCRFNLVCWHTELVIDH